MLKKILLLCTLCLSVLLTSSHIVITSCAQESLLMDINTYSYYNLLNSKEQSNYNQILDNMTNLNQELFELNNKVSENSLCNIMNAIFNDHPEIFWVQTAYSYAINSDNQVTKVKLKFYLSKEKLPEAIKEYDNYLNSLVNKANLLNSKLEQEEYLHNEICKNCEYDGLNERNQSAYSALIDKTSVCAGYARAFQEACKRCNIPCYYIMGTDEQGGSHAWNIVEIDGVNYNVDLTWDDLSTTKDNSISLAYFNRNDNDFDNSHIKSELSTRFVNILM